MRKWQIFVVLCLLVLCISFSACTEEEPFSFRNGIQFGMSLEELKQKEKENGNLDDSIWASVEIGNWKMFGTHVPVEVSNYKANLIYLLANDCMEAAGYDFNDISAEESVGDAFKYIRQALSAVYGENEPVAASKIVELMDAFSQGFYSEADIREAVKWELSTVMIYQFYYDEDQFVVMYIDPKFDYASVNKSTVNVNGL